MLPSYFNVYDLLTSSTMAVGKAAIKPLLSGLSPLTKAILIFLLLVLVTGVMGAIAVYTTWKVIPLAILGVFYGVMLSYPATRFFGPKLQSYVAGIVSTITFTNLSSKITAGKTAVVALGAWISEQVKSVIPTATGLQTPVQVAIWFVIVTLLLIMLISLYFVNDNSNKIGDKIEPPNQAGGATAGK